jgi:hypothetical protein
MAFDRLILRQAQDDEGNVIPACFKQESSGYIFTTSFDKLRMTMNKLSMTIEPGVRDFAMLNKLWKSFDRLRMTRVMSFLHVSSRNPVDTFSLHPSTSIG